MNTTFLVLLACWLLCWNGAGADTPAKSAGPRFKARIACFNGKLDSGSSCSGNTFQPDGIIHPTGKMACGFPGKVSEIEWSFVERRGDNDVYRFTRRFPTDTSATTTSSKSVEFSDKRVIVFQDELQAVVIEPPKQGPR